MPSVKLYDMRLQSKAIGVTPAFLRAQQVVREGGVARIDQGALGTKADHLGGFIFESLNNFELEQNIAGQALAATAHVEAPTSEPARYEQRLVAPNGNAAPWSVTSKIAFDKFSANPDVGDGFTYEVRALYDHATPQALPATEHAAVTQISKCSACNGTGHVEIAQAKPDASADAYNELIYAVGAKWPSESRHQTALRYIREREKPSGSSVAATTRKTGGPRP
jgi:hypothetical protein